MDQSLVNSVTPVLVNAALGGRPRYDWGEVERNAEEVRQGVTTKRLAGWIDGSAFGSPQVGEAGSEGPNSKSNIIENEELYRGGMARVEGSAVAVLQMLRIEKRREREKLKADIEGGGGKGKRAVVEDDGDEGEVLMLVRTGGNTVASSSVRSPVKKEGKRKKGGKKDSLIDEVAEAGRDAAQRKDLGAGVDYNSGSGSDSGSDDDLLSDTTQYEDKRPLSVGSVSRAGLLGLVALLRNLKNSKSGTDKNDAATRMFVCNGGVCALLLLAFYRFGEDAEMGKAGGVHNSTTTLLLSQSQSRAETKPFEYGPELMSARSSISTSSNFSSSVGSVATTTTADVSGTNTAKSHTSVARLPPHHQAIQLQKLLPPSNMSSLTSAADHRQYVNVYLQHQVSE